MDRKLVAWARAVKARRHVPPRARRAPMPVLFLVLDDRLPDASAAVRALVALPGAAGLVGVLLRARTGAAREALAAAVLPACRARRVTVLVAGDDRLARRTGCGVHWPGGRRSLVRPHPLRLRGASVHGARERARVRLAGVDAVFVSPVFATASHPGAAPLGVRRAARLARGGRPFAAAFALGGVDGRRARALPRAAFAGAAAVAALR